IEQEGTYPLPEAQLDRFMFKILVDYPSFEEELAIAETTTAGELPKIAAVLDREAILETQRTVRKVLVARPVAAYAGKLVRATRLGRGTGLRQEVPDLGSRAARLPGTLAGGEGPCPARWPRPRLDGGHSIRRAPGAASPPGNELPRRKRRRDGGPHRRETVPGRPRTAGEVKKELATDGHR